MVEKNGADQDHTQSFKAHLRIIEQLGRSDPRPLLKKIDSLLLPATRLFLRDGYDNDEGD
jgi:hypothetical protein